MSEVNKKSPLVNKRGTRPIQYENPKYGLRAITENAEDSKPIRKLRGYAILFDVLGKPWRGSTWQEKVEKNALDGVDFSNVVVLWDHQTTWVLGRNGKNARLEVDDVGLFVEVTLGDTWFDDYVYDRASLELVDGMSFYFDSNATIATDWTNKVDIITKINNIYEVSLLAFPAYDETLMIAIDSSEQVDSSTETAEEVLDEVSALINAYAYL